MYVHSHSTNIPYSAELHQLITFLSHHTPSLCLSHPSPLLSHPVAHHMSVAGAGPDSVSQQQQFSVGTCGGDVGRDVAESTPLCQLHPWEQGAEVNLVHTQKHVPTVHKCSVHIRRFLQYPVKFARYVLPCMLSC